MRRSIGGTLTPGALAALTGQNRYRPYHRDAMRAAAVELARRGLTARDVAAALRLSEAAVQALLEVSNV
jgi:hypothetical protein